MLNLYSDIMKNPAPAVNPRYALIDALRGTAIVLMFIYHFSFDLNYFGYLDTNFYTDPFWINFRILIVSTFLAVVGISLYVAHHRRFKPGKFLRRLFILLACALLVSLASYLMFPRSMIFFGILHFIALASILALPFLRLYWLNLFLGLGIIILGIYFEHRIFDQPSLQWLGMMTHKPVTEDYVPLIPWFGVVLLGMFLARWGQTRQNFPLFSQWRADTAALRGLRFAGRHSLLIYMLHQPVFIGLLYAVYNLSH